MLEQIAKDIAATVKEHVQAGIKALSEKFDQRLGVVEKRFNELPLPKDGKDGRDGESITIDDVAPLIKELVAAIEIPLPENGKDGEPGKSVTLDDVLPSIEKAIENKIQEIDLPKIDYETVKNFITEEIAKIPAPKDGKDFDIEDIKPLLKQLVDAIEIPVPMDGENGKDGSSVSVEDVKPIIHNAVKAVIAEMPLPKDGEPGKDAEPVDMDAVQKMIDAAVAKAVDMAVSRIDIPTPKDGTDGKDALDIEILPEINPEKSYNRNVYALHKGGLWRSFERTKDMRGWEVVMNGIADIQIDYDGERGVKIITEKSSGEVVSKEFVMPMVIDRGIYREGETYVKNDGLTYAGSYWIAQKDAPQGRPGDGNSDFRLAVKRGRDAVPKVKVGK